MVSSAVGACVLAVLSNNPTHDSYCIIGFSLSGGVALHKLLYVIKESIALQKD